jgi:polar amino acid transport system permease protein
MWDWQFTLDIMPLLLAAAVVTLQATVIGYVLALVIGLVFALLRRSGSFLVAHATREVVEFIRSTPLLVQIYFVYFVFPEFGISLSAWVAGLLALGLHYGCYTSEVYRAGLDGVPRGQWEAARALNLGAWRTYRDVILPQAIPPIVPALGNYLIGIFKETPLLSVIAIIELLGRAKIIGSETFRYLEPITMVGVFFLVMSLAASGLIRLTERRLRLPGH